MIIIMIIIMVIIVIMFIIIMTNLIGLTSQPHCCGPEAEPSPPCIAMSLSSYRTFDDHDDDYDDNNDISEDMEDDYQHLASFKHHL